MGWRRLALVLITLAAPLAAGQPAPAIERCERRCDQSYGGQCVTWRTTCQEDSPTPKVSYGAIAYGRESEAFGYSHGWDSQAKAEKVAMQNCRKHGKDCEVVVWFERKCGAVAVSANGGAVYWGLGDAAPQARAEAMAQCAKDGGKDCQVKVSHCSK